MENMGNRTIELEVTAGLARVLEDISLETRLPLKEIVARALAYGVIKAFTE